MPPGFGLRRGEITPSALAHWTPEPPSARLSPSPPRSGGEGRDEEALRAQGAAVLDVRCSRVRGEAWVHGKGTRRFHVKLRRAIKSGPSPVLAQPPHSPAMADLSRRSSALVRSVAESNFRNGGANLPVCLGSPQGIATSSEITFGKSYSSRSANHFAP